MIDTVSSTRRSTAGSDSRKSMSALRALVVDDDEFMLTVIEALLNDLGVVSILTATNGAAGLEAYDRAVLKPDVVLCDLSMPVSDGFQFMEALSGKGYSGGVALISGMDARTLNSASLMAQFHRLKFLGTLKKPVDKWALGTALSKLT